MADDSDRKRMFWAFSILGLMLIVSLWYYSVHPVYMYIVTYLWFGVAYGLLLQWGRFCFASAWRDLIAIGVTRMFVGIMIAMAVFSVIMAILAEYRLSTFHPGPLGPHELIGGLIFGIGMVLAGGCASGTLYKIGEGNGTSVIALTTMIFGQAIFVDIGGWFDQLLRNYIFPRPAFTMAEKLYGTKQPGLAKMLIADSLINTIIPIILLFIFAYVVVARKGIIKQIVQQKASAAADGEVKTTFSDELRGFWYMITASKRTTIAGVLIGIIAGFHVLAMQNLRYKFGIGNFGHALKALGQEGVSARGTVFDPGYWYITTQEAQVGGWVLHKLGWNMMDNIYFGMSNGLPDPWWNPALLMSVGIIFGAMVMAMLNKEFKLKKPTKELALWGFLGGVFMGVGARVALGCNIGAFYIRVAGGDPGGWLFFLGMGGGALVAVRFMNWWSERKLKAADIDIEIE